MFIDDEKTKLRLTRSAKVIRIAFPTRAAGHQETVFEVAGLDRTKFPELRS